MSVRYRLRFHLQEIDLAGSAMVVGRGSTCQLTIDDPMLSRRHLRIDLTGPQPILEDLQSRNGTQLNGRPVLGRAALRDGDRIRIGTQELVFVVADVPKTDFRTTSGLRFCVGCALPHPVDAGRCPHCGAVSTDEAVPSSAREAGSSGWTFHLLCQVVHRAMEQGRLADAERMLSRGVSELDEQLGAEMSVEPARIAELAECATRLGCMLQNARWIEVGARLYGSASELPGEEVLTLVDQLPSTPALGEAVSALRQMGCVSRRAV